nr:hypothetical protein [Diaphorobacter ruginosibacter]
MADLCTEGHGKRCEDARPAGQHAVVMAGVVVAAVFVTVRVRSLRRPPQQAPQPMAGGAARAFRAGWAWSCPWSLPWSCA